MAQHWTDFSDSPTITERWNTGNYAATIQSSGLPSGAGSHALRIQLSTSAARYAVSWDDPGSPSGDVEVLIRWQHAHSSNANFVVGAIVHGGGAAGSEDAYIATANTGSSVAIGSLNEYDNNASTGHGNFSGAIDRNVWNRIRIQRTGTTIRAKWWADGDTEPGSWGVSTTDSSHASGWVGIWSVLSAGTTWIDWIGVGTGGDPAPDAAVNTAPTITVAPTVSYGSQTRTGPNNTPAVVSFTATDPDDAGADELDYEIRTASGGGGTLVTSGTCTSGANQNVNIAHNASGINDGSNTLYMVVSDGTDSDEESFTLLVDRTAPVTFTPASDPSPVDGTRDYAVEMTANDTTSTGADELLYEVRTAASGAGTLLSSGNRTSSGTPFTTATFTDDALEEGNNTRYVRVVDGAGNVREVSFTVTGENLPTPVVSSITVVAPRRPPRPVLTFYPPLGATNDWQPYEIPLTGIGGLVTYSRVPGGFGELNVMVNPEMARWPGASQHPYRSVDSRFVTYGHVTLTDGDLTLFEGRLVKTTEVAGAVRAIRVMGYGFHAMRDADFESSSSTTTTTGNIVKQVLANAAAFIRVATGSDFVDPQVEHAPEEFSLMMPADIMAQISSEGDDDGNPVDWAIWEGQRLHLKPRVAPSQPHYALAAGDRRILNREADDSDLRGRVRISYTDAATGDPALTDWYSNRTGNHRRLTVAASELTETSANRLAQAYATLYSSPYLAITVETSQDDMLPGAYGEPVPAYLARAGEWWLVGDDTPVMAIDVQQDWSSGRTRIQLGDEGESYQAMLAWLERDIEKRRGGLNPVGGRAR